MGTSTGRLWDPVAGCPGDQIMERSGYVSGMSVIHVFIQVTQDIIVNFSSKNFNEQYSD